MTTADQYRVKALEFAEMANNEGNPRLQLEYAGMADLYFRLAHHAENNLKSIGRDMAVSATQPAAE
jgi:hypothetical protein